MREIALVSSEYPPHIFGGLGVHVERTTALLSDLARYDLFVPGRADYLLPPPAIQLHRVPVPNARTDLEFWLQFCGRVARLVEESPVHVHLVHCHDWMTILAGMALRQILHVPLVFNVHLPQPANPRLYLENLGLAAADLVIVNSEAVRTEIAQRGIPVSRMEVVPNGVDLEHFTPAEDWPADDGYVLFVGRLVAQKGVDVLLQAFAVVLRRCPRSRLFVVGEGDLELYLKRVARYLGILDRVSFVPWQTGTALLRLYQRAQVAVMPSYYEPFGIVALEVMACSRPLVASRVGGLAELVEDGVQGYLVPVGDHLAMAGRLAELILRPGRRQEMGRAARERAAQFTWAATSSRTAALYDDLLNDAFDARMRSEAYRLGQVLKSGVSSDLAEIAAGILDRYC